MLKKLRWKRSKQKPEKKANNTQQQSVGLARPGDNTTLTPDSSLPSNGTPNKISPLPPAITAVSRSSIFTIETHKTNRKGQQASDPLGLTLIYGSDSPQVDIIFVHGLGGSSLRTWSYNRDVKNLWLSWLGEEAGLSNTRVFTFGYNANYAQGATSFTILDFAKHLLFQIKMYRDEAKEDSKPIGDHPLIFVAHSMGGLVVKKAYITGKYDEQYSRIISQIYGIVFLATPHRGSNFALILNNILRIPPTAGAKIHVNELEGGSTSINYINEQFRNICDGLELVSFYETLKRVISPGVIVMIVEKESAILGYPREISAPLHADHNGISKYLNREDGNYMAVRDILKMIVRGAKQQNHSCNEITKLSIPSPTSTIEKVLGIRELIDDLEVIRKWIQPRSCSWILEKKGFQDWLDESALDLSILWLTGLPGVGKSTLSGFIIDHFSQHDAATSCQYYFFKANEHGTRTISHFLRSIAFQVAEACDDFRSRLLEAHQKTGILFASQKYSVIWEKVFEKILFQCTFNQPLIWVLDGIDEAESPNTIVTLISRIKSMTPIRVLLVSRQTRDLSVALTLDSCRVYREDIQISDTADDIRLFVSISLRCILPNDKVRQSVIERVLSKSFGSFLWAKLATESIKGNWHTDFKIEKALGDIPEGMEMMYERMMDIIVGQPPNLVKMATEILTWVACSFRPLSIEELAVALKAEFENFYNLKVTIAQICGGFVVTRNSTVTIIHETANQFLVSKNRHAPILIDSRKGHSRVARVCMDYLSQSKWRTELATIHATRESNMQDAYSEVPFLSYAIAYWAYHVNHSPEDLDFQLSILEFLSQSALVWIYAVSLTGNFQTIICSAQYLRSYAERAAEHLIQSPLTNSNLGPSQKLVLWSNDLIRLVGRFGSHLVEFPPPIYKYVIPSFHAESILAQTFRHLSQNAITILGISSWKWDDCLARLTMGNDETAFKIICKDKLFITLLVWSSETCLEVRRLYHDEWVTSIKAAKTRNLLASAGTQTIRVWDISLGTNLCGIPVASGHRVLSLAFSSNNTELLIADDSSTIKCIDLNSEEEKWNFEANPASEYGPPRAMIFSPDTRRIAIVQPTLPLMVWRISHRKNLPQQFIRKRAIHKYSRWGKDILNSPGKVIWKPNSAGVLILYPGTLLIDWNVDDDTQTEHSHIIAHEIVMSSDGKLLLTSDHNNTLSVWSADSFRLIYQLKYEGIVRDIAFSPDSRRLYDIRDTICNIREPAALQRLDDSDKGYIFSEAVVSPDSINRLPISALTCGDRLPYHCAGKEDGSVVIYETRTSERLRKLYGHSNTASVVHIAWSLSQKYIASADDEGRVIAKRLKPPTSEAPQKWAVYALLDLQLCDPLLQLLFSTSEELLLISTLAYDEVWSTKSKKKLLHVKRENESHHRRWMNHPRDSKLLVCIEGSEQYIYTWNDLEKVSVLGVLKTTRNDNNTMENSLYSKVIEGTSEESEYIGSSPAALEAPERVFQIGDRYLILEYIVIHGFEKNIRPHTKPSRRLEVIDFNDAQLGRRVLTQLSNQVNRLVGVVLGQLVSLNHQHWLCTWELDSGEDSYQKHFFLPKDWIFPETLDLATVDQFGNLLWPRDGEIAIIQSGIRI